MYQNWGDEYSIEFDIVVKKLSNIEWINVFHFTGTNKDGPPYHLGIGNRIPALFVHKDGFFHFTTSLNNNGNYPKNSNFVVGQTYHILIKQSKHGSKYWYEIIINGESKLKKENKNAKSYPTVRFYNSDPWWESFTSEFGNVCNLKVQHTGMF